VKRIDDKELCHEFIGKAIQMAEKFDEENHGWSKRYDILVMTVLAQCWIEDFDGARKIIDKFGNPVEMYVNTLVNMEKFDLLETVLSEIKIEGHLLVFAWRAIAMSKLKDGDKVGAIEAIKTALHFTLNDPNIYRDINPVQLFDLALDLKYTFADAPGRAPMESVHEITRWHRDILERKSTDAADYTEKELRHLLRIVGANDRSPEELKTKLRTMGAPIYPLLYDVIKEALASERESSMRINDWIALIDIKKADPKELRMMLLAIREKHKMVRLIQCYHMWGEVGLPEDVPGLLVWREDYLSDWIIQSFQAVAKIASPEQLPMIEKAAEEAEKVYFEWVKKLDVQYQESLTKNWNNHHKPEIDKALQTINERK
jgi:hypothetical protein